MRILIAGGAGFIGRHLVSELLKKSHEIIVLSRNPEKAKGKFANIQDSVSFVGWQQLELDLAIHQCDVVINLAGSSIINLWTPKVKQQILKSRVNSTKALVDSINKNEKPKTLINLSAVGYYGSDEEKQFVESDPSGTGFLANVCINWEKAAHNLDPKHRLLILRSGLVLDPSGSFLNLLVRFFKIFGGIVPGGQQWICWIALTDWIKIILFLIEQSDLKGAVNAVAPTPTRMEKLCHLLAKSLKRPCWLTVPSWLIKSLGGEMGNFVLEGQKVIPKKLEDNGFEFDYPRLENYLSTTFQKPQR